MSTQQAEYNFRSAEVYSINPVNSNNGYIPAFAFHRSMALGMLEMTRALAEMQAKLDRMEAKLNPPRPQVQATKINPFTLAAAR